MAKNLLRAAFEECGLFSQQNWQAYLTFVALAMNASLVKAIGTSPFMAMFGVPARLPAHAAINTEMAAAVNRLTSEIDQQLAAGRAVEAVAAGEVEATATLMPTELQQLPRSQRVRQLPRDLPPPPARMPAPVQRRRLALTAGPVAPGKDACKNVSSFGGLNVFLV